MPPPSGFPISLSVVDEMIKILVIHGPNLNLLGTREPSKYGTATLGDINETIKEAGEKDGITVNIFQSNHEGEIIDWIHGAVDKYSGIIINPGAFTHYSYAIRDAIAAVGLPVIEVHLTNIYSREKFRHHSVIAPAAMGQISGLGVHGYLAAFHSIIHIIRKKGWTPNV